MLLNSLEKPNNSGSKIFPIDIFLMANSILVTRLKISIATLQIHHASLDQRTSSGHSTISCGDLRS